MKLVLRSEPETRHFFTGLARLLTRLEWIFFIYTVSFSGRIKPVFSIRSFRQLKLLNIVHIIDKLLLKKKNKTSLDSNGSVSSINHFFPTDQKNIKK